MRMWEEQLVSTYAQMLECAVGKSRGAASEMDEGVVGSQSHGPGSDRGTGLEPGLQGHPPTCDPAVWTSHPEDLLDCRSYRCCSHLRQFTFLL